MFVGCDQARRAALGLSALESLDFAYGFDVGLLGLARYSHFTLDAQVSIAFAPRASIKIISKTNAAAARREEFDPTYLLT